MKYPIFHSMEQRSEEWYEIRKGKMTASNAQSIAANGKGLDTYCKKIIAEYYSGVTDKIENEHILRGIEYEETAKQAYEIITGKELYNIGFVQYSDYSGCSPDALILGEEKGIEIKCPSPAVYLEVLLDNYIDPKYYAQIQMNMLCCNYKLWDYVVYNKDFKSKQLTIIEIKRDEDYIEKLKEGLKTGEKTLKELHKKVEEKIRRAA